MKKQNYAIGNEEIEHIMEYILDKRLQGMKNKLLFEGLHVAFTLLDSSFTQYKIINVRLLLLMHYCQD